MSAFKVSEAAALLGVSDDTVRRWIDAGRLPAARPEAGGCLTIDGKDLAHLAQTLAAAPAGGQLSTLSARNRFAGIVTRVVTGTVMAQVEIQCGRHRVVSLLTTEAVEELGLEPGVLASAMVKATQVVVEGPGSAA